MKNILILMFLIVAAYGFGQIFSEQHQEEETQTQFFSEEHQPYTEPDPDLGVDAGPGGPGTRVPIDDWAFLLPLAAVGIGIYFLRRKQKSEII